MYSYFRSRFVFVKISLLLFVVTFSVALAQNERLFDGGFESTGVSNWTIVSNGATLTTVSSPTRTGSGAAALATTANPGSRATCVDISSPLGANFTFAGYVYVPNSVTNINALRVRVTYWNNTNCTGGPVGPGPLNIAFATRDTWLPFSFTPTTDITGKNGMLITVETGSNDANPVTVYWDDLTVYDSSPTAVSLQSFSATNPATGLLLFGSALILTFIASLFLRRRVQG